MPPKEASLGYELPAAIESIKDGWQKTCQTGAAVSAMFTVLSILLLSFVNGAGLLDQGPRNSVRAFLALVSYGALFFNLSASVSGFVLIDRLAVLPFHAAQKSPENLPAAGYIQGDSDDLLKRYGVGRVWSLLVVHWFCCYVAGIWCIVLEILVYLWLLETTVVKTLLTIVGAVSLLPLISFVAPLWKTITGNFRLM